MMTPDLDQPSRLVSLPKLAWSLALYVALNFLLIFVLFPMGAFHFVTHATAGLISSTLLANAVLLGGVLIAVCRKGGPGWNEIGLRRTGMGSALAATFLLWLGLNFLQWAIGVFVHAPVTVNAAWADSGAGPTLGVFLGQLLGNALFEEVFFRGILFPQLWWHLLVRGRRPATALIMALIISQTIFALIHVPLRISSGLALAALPGELGLLLMLGLLLALCYWRTGNLYLVIGIHALSNAPTLVVAQQVDLSTSGSIAAEASILAMLVWPYASHFPQYRLTSKHGAD